MRLIEFESHTYLHHSQTQEINPQLNTEFESHTYLHHSQTSKLKMNCLH